LQYPYAGSNGYRKERSPTVLGKILQKSPRTISRELDRGMVEHVLTETPFTRIEYNGEHAQFDTQEKMKYKGPSTKSGKHHELVQRMAELILEEHYSPYALLERLGKEEAWPQGLRICEKTLYNWIEAGDIPGVAIGNLPRKGGDETQGRPWKVKDARQQGILRPIHRETSQGGARAPTARPLGGRHGLQQEGRVERMLADSGGTQDPPGSDTQDPQQ